MGESRFPQLVMPVNSGSLVSAYSVWRAPSAATILRQVHSPNGIIA